MSPPAFSQPFWSQTMNDEMPLVGISEREEARARLARQIGRLLAREWLNREHDEDGEKPCEANGTDAVA
jgi:hypothetical protein